MSWQDGVRQFWDPAAGWWHQESAAMWETGPRREIVPFLQRVTGLPPGARVLDAGCGTGQGTLLLARAGYQVTGLDVSPAMLAKAREAVAAAGVEIEFREGSLDALTWGNREFAGLLCVTALEFTEVPSRCLAEFRRVLKPGGWAVIVVLGPLAPPRSNTYRRLFGEPVYMNTMMPWELVRLLESTGWQVRRQEGLYGPEIDPGWIGALAGDPARQACLSQLWMVAARA